MLDDGRGQMFYGKYEGVVTKAVDPLQGGRLEVLVPHVHGGTPIWARPCVPYAEAKHGIFMMPPVGAKVWVEFMAGDRNRAIWAGCYWADGDVPVQDPTERIISTPAGVLRFGSKTKQADISLDTAGGLKLVLSGANITIDTGKGGKIEIAGTTVKVNGGALEVI